MSYSLSIHAILEWTPYFRDLTTNWIDTNVISVTGISLIKTEKFKGSVLEKKNKKWYTDVSIRNEILMWGRWRTLLKNMKQWRWGLIETTLTECKAVAKAKQQTVLITKLITKQFPRPVNIFCIQFWRAGSSRDNFQNMSTRHESLVLPWWGSITRRFYLGPESDGLIFNRAFFLCSLLLF